MIQSDFIEVNGERIPHYYLCHYKPLSSGFDRLSKSLIGFKRGISVDLEAWTSCAVESFSHPLLSPTLIVRALHSRETNVAANNSSLDQLGISFADSLNGSYVPETLQKAHVILPMKQLSRAMREETLTDIYSFQPPGSVYRSILLIDDIITTGCTIGAIVRAIRKANLSVPIVAFTLASTESASRLNEAVVIQSPSYEWNYEVGWNVAEDIPKPLAINMLKESIVCNFSDPE